MDRLIESFRGIFIETANAGGELARTSNFLLENVDFTQKPTTPEPMNNPVTDKYLKLACENSGPDHSSSRKVAEALLAVSDQLAWRRSTTSNALDADVVAFAPNFTSNSIIGAEGLLCSDKVSAGFSLQGPDTYYPPHAHVAEESYWIIGGDGDWRVDADPWFAVEPGSTVYHCSGARHAMQTNRQPLLSIWLWTSHLDCEVMIVRA